MRKLQIVKSKEDDKKSLLQLQNCTWIQIVQLEP